jgi:two-component system, chemotaxis family, CheB/CheR fusion protein
VRNSLAVVRSIARRTAENSTSVDEMIAHLQGRLDAFARVQAKLTRAPDNRADLMSLVEDEMVAHAVRDGEQVKISGPDVSLQPPLAERMSLAVHELATNAVKHGALAANAGKVSISWKLQHPSNGRMLLFKWQESGMNLDEEPQHEGFGMELLRR